MDNSHDPAESDTEALPSRWARATSGDAEALRELAGSCWYCAYAWWRRSGRDAEGAAMATLAAFTHWIAGAPPGLTQTGGARLREWLPARLAEMSAQGVHPAEDPAIAIEPAWAEQLYADEPVGDPDALFQRRWALTVLEFTMASIRAEYAARAGEALFVEVSPFAGFEDGDDEHYAAAGRAGLTIGATRKAVFDFRTRHREVLRAYVGDTVADPADLDSEMTALLCACDLPDASATPAPLPAAIGSFQPDQLLARAMRTVQMSSGGAGQWTPPTDAEIERLFPHYEMLGMLGRGGMGAVYKARQIQLDRLVAIKLLPLEISVDKDFADRFRREARAMAKLNHPNVIAVHDFGTTTEGHLYFAMEYVEGANLADTIHRAGLDEEQTLNIAEQVCTALAYAHGKGIVHRDIKPANVMISTEGQVKVADFGLARLTDPSAEQMGQTMTGTVMGTPDYMAPEQMRGMNVDHRADIYSLGVMLYEMLCREVPKGIFEPPSHRTGCDARIDQIVIRAMQQAPDRRYQSTQELKADVTAARAPAAIVPTGPPAAPPRPKTALPAPPRVVKVVASPAAAKKSKAPLFAGIAGVLALALGAAWVFTSRQKPAALPLPAAASQQETKPSAQDVVFTTTKDMPSAPVDEAGFRPLFDGRTLAGWRALDRDAPAPGWSVADGAITGKPRSGLMTQDAFGDFELRLEWRVNPKGNGGVYYRIAEDGMKDRPQNAIELQLMDDSLAQKPTQITGSAFDIEPASEKAAHPPGEWNTARLLVQGSHIEHWINERLVCRYDLADPAIRDLLQRVKPGGDFTHPVKGRLGLQAWDGEVFYRNLRIRENAPPRVGERQADAKVSPAADGWKSLLPLINPQKDGVEGEWTVVNGELHGTGSSFARLALPYAPPEEYDFRIAFTRETGSLAVSQHIAGATQDAMWLMGGFGNAAWGLEQVNGAKGNLNATTIKSGLENGRRYVSVVKVRRNRIQVEVDGRQVVDYPTTWSDLSMNSKWVFPDPKKLGVGCQQQTTFHSIEVRTVTSAPHNP